MKPVPKKTARLAKDKFPFQAPSKIEGAFLCPWTARNLFTNANKSLCFFEENVKMAGVMKHALFISTLAAAALLFAGCETTGPDTQQGAVLGGLGGAALGGIIGHQSGHALEGAAIGGGLGALAGGVYGNAEDQRRAEKLAYERQLAADRAESARVQAEADRARLLSSGYSTEAPEVLSAKQRAETLEAQVAQLRKEQAEAIQRAREIEAYRAREAAAQEELIRLKAQQNAASTTTY
jgi:hypothetical protein